MPTETINLLSKETNASTRITTINTTFVTADVIGLAYTFMPSCRPSDYGALVAIWQDADQIPWDNPPLSTQAITSNQQQGTVAFDGLSVQSNTYIIGLLAAPQKTDSQKARNVVASAYVPNESDPATTASDFLTLTYVGQTSVAVQYSALAGYRALTDQAWLGMWRGESASYNNPPDYAVQIKIDSNFGTVSFNNVSIGVGLTYTIGMFASGWSSDTTTRNQKALACSLTFTQGR